MLLAHQRYFAHLAFVSRLCLFSRPALACSQGSAFQEMAKEIAKAALILLILDKLWVQKNEAWFEDSLDFLSVQASILGRSDLGFLGRTRVHMNQISYVGLSG